jgi:hypothetical protein
MASEDLKRLVAAEVAHGASTGELAERFDYTARGMRKLIASPAVQHLVAEERQALAEQVDRYRVQLVGMGEKAIENVRRVLDDPRHPRNAETSRWLLDKIAFGRGDASQAEAPGPSVNLTQQAIVFLNERLPKLAESLDGYTPVPLEEDPHLIPARTGGR